MMNKVNLTYFKESGKYYSNGEFTTILEYLHDIFQLCRLLKINGYLPDLVIGAKEFYVLIDVPTHEHNHPHLIPIDCSTEFKHGVDPDVTTEFFRIMNERNTEENDK